MKELNKNSSYFTKVEDKYVFRVSTIFWHLLIGAITLSAIIGIALFGWSLIPSLKEQVKAIVYPAKPSYPSVEKVTLADLNLGEGKSQPVYVPVPPPVYQPPPQAEEENDLGKPAYDLSLAELKKIIPQDQWQPGHFDYPEGEDAYTMHLTEAYRHWNPSGENVEQRLDKSYGIIRAKKYIDKKKALDAYLKILKQVSPANSNEVLSTIINGINTRYCDLHLLDSNFAIIASGLRIFKISNKDATQHLIDFTFNNPNATFDFIPFAIKTCSQFEDTFSYPVLTVLTSGFYNYFNGNVEIQKDITSQYSELISQLPASDPANILRKFYYAHNKKNQKRNEEIGRINAEYNSQIAALVTDSLFKVRQSEIAFENDKQSKNIWRWKSVYAIAGGFISIALLGTILTLLSIQRILKRMEVAAENKNP